MTTTIKVTVSGRNRATVRQTKADGTMLPVVEVHGDYNRSPNPSGEMMFNIGYPPTTMFEVIEESLTDDGPRPVNAEPIVQPEPEPVKEAGPDKPADETKPEPVEF